MFRFRTFSGIVAILICLLSAGSAETDEAFSLDLRYQHETRENTGRFHTFWKATEWDAEKTAFIVCDMWDSHHSVTAARRVGVLAPHLNEVLKAARERGATIIHAPSDCMKRYADHPARKRASGIPKADNYPDGIAAWCHRIPEEEKARYPIDQSDGGEDESAWENAQWTAKLKAEGRNAGTPWLTQHPALEIKEGDYVAAEGDVVWNILKYEGIEHVALTGVHTNMCVLGRPFGLRRMVAAEIDTVLVRDCTDLMYNPARWPYVSHFTGLDLIIGYIEAHVCPTVTSDQIVGGRPFRFSHDRRPHLAILIGEREYKTEQTLPEFARRFLGKDFRVTIAFADVENRHLMPGVRAIEDADLLLVSVRRRGLPAEDMGRIRRFVESGKPVLGIRTASHAFAPKDETPDGHGSWGSFDPDVFGGSYDGHYKEGGPVSLAKGAEGHPVLAGLPEGGWESNATLYRTAPLLDGAQVLAKGKTRGDEPAEPLAWTYVRKDGGRSFYTSLGHVDDFADPNFQRLLVNAVYWAADLKAPEELAAHPDHRRWNEDWAPATPADLEATHSRLPEGGKGATLWIRTLVEAPPVLKAGDRSITWAGGKAEVFLNGKALEEEEEGSWAAPEGRWKAGKLNLLSIRIFHTAKSLIGFERRPPALVVRGKATPLDGTWQVRVLEKGQGGEHFPIPPQFGAPADLIQNWPAE